MLPFVDGFSFCFAVLLLVLHLIPESVEHSPTLGLLFAAIGFALPGVGDLILGKRRTGDPSGSTSSARQSFGLTIGGVLVAVGLGAHGAFDGYALSQFGQDRALIVGILVHRLPIGIVLWRYGKAYGTKHLGTLLLVSLCLGTITGACIAALMGREAATSSQLFANDYQYAFQALVGGGLLHIILARPLGVDRTICFSFLRARHGVWQLSQSGLGAIVAIVFFFFAVGSTGPMSTKIIEYALEASVGLVVAFGLSGLLPLLLSKQGVADWMSRGGAASQSIRGMLLGLPLPICSCGVLPMYRSLISAGVPVATATSFLISTPELGFDSMLLSVSLLGWPVFIVRVVTAALVSFVAGIAMGYSKDSKWVDNTWIDNSTEQSPSGDKDTLAIGTLLTGHHHTHSHSHAVDPIDGKVGKSRGWINQILHFGFEERFVDIVPWVLAGFVIAAFVDWAVPDQLFKSMSGLMSLVVLVALATPAYVCASGATPLAASMLRKGLPLGSVIAFLLSGPSTNVTTFGVFNRLHGKLGAVRFAITMVLLSLVCGMVINSVVDYNALSSFFASSVDIGSSGVLLSSTAIESAAHHGAHHSGAQYPGGQGGLTWYQSIQWGCLIVLLVGVIHNLLRVGPRGFASALIKVHAAQSASDPHRKDPDSDGVPAGSMHQSRTQPDGGCC